VILGIVCVAIQMSPSPLVGGLGLVPLLLFYAATIDHVLAPVEFRSIKRRPAGSWRRHPVRRRRGHALTFASAPSGNSKPSLHNPRPRLSTPVVFLYSSTAFATALLSGQDAAALTAGDFSILPRADYRGPTLGSAPAASRTKRRSKVNSREAPALKPGWRASAKSNPHSYRPSTPATRAGRSTWVLGSPRIGGRRSGWRGGAARRSPAAPIPAP
jgi:hypothetical protein